MRDLQAVEQSIRNTHQ